MSYSSWDIRGRQAHVTVRVSELDMSRLPWGELPPDQRNRDMGAYLSKELQLLAGDTACPVTDGPRRLDSTPGTIVYEWAEKCPAQGALRVHSDLLLDLAPTHLHVARVTLDGGEPLERVLSDGERTWKLDDPTKASGGVMEGTSLLDYIDLGIRHILSGYDHLAFLLALLLIGNSLGEVAKVVTGFTVAHSITLGLSVLGYIRPEARPIEALIGLSIALVAMENVWLVSGRGRALPWFIAGALLVLAGLSGEGHGHVPALTLAGLALFTYCYFGLLGKVSRPALARWAIAFIFGLIHGFGFAGVLADAHLSPDRLVHALFGFNAGVEIGQLSVVAVLWPVLHLAAKRERLQLGVVEFGSAAVAGLGIFWFVTRAFG